MSVTAVRRQRKMVALETSRFLSGCKYFLCLDSWRDQKRNDEIDESRQGESKLFPFGFFKVDDAGMSSLITDDPASLEYFIKIWRKVQTFDSVVKIFPFSAEVIDEVLNAQT